MKSEKPPVGKAKLIFSNKNSIQNLKIHQTAHKSNENIPKDVWKHFRRPHNSSINTDTIPDEYSVSSSESPHSSDNYNPMLDETIGQFYGNFDLLEEESDTLSHSSNISNSYNSASDTPADIDTLENSPSLSQQKDSYHTDDLMYSFSLIVQEVSDTSKKSNKELAADQAVWELQRDQPNRWQRGP